MAMRDPEQWVDLFSDYLFRYIRDRLSTDSWTYKRVLISGRVVLPGVEKGNKTGEEAYE